MARLLIKTEGLVPQTLELRLGVNRVGRSPDCDFPVSHATVSSNHCELVLSGDGVLLRDCNSTNGTFINGDPVREAWLMPGQQVKLGDVELFVENTEINVTIPQYERPSQLPPTPVALPDGAISCTRHTQTHAAFKCTHCNEVMCNACVHIMRRQGGQALYLCVLCSHKCEPIFVAQPKKKKSFIGFLEDTVRLKFRHSAREKKP